MGTKISKRYFLYKSQQKAFKLFLNVLPNVPHKTAFEIFEILINFSFSLTLDPMGAKISKRTAESFQTFPDFFS